MAAGAVAIPAERSTLAVPAPVHAGAAPSRANLALSLDTIQSFAGRTKLCYRACEDIANYLPHEGPACQEALDMVTEERKWLHDMNVAVGDLVGTFFALEMNTLKELKRMWNTAIAPGVTLDHLIINFQAGHNSLSTLTKDREHALAVVDMCKAKGTELIAFQGKEMKLQHAFLEVVKKHAGEKQCEALQDDLDAAMTQVQKAEHELNEAAESLAFADGEVQEVSDRAAIFESVSQGRKDKNEAVEARARQMAQSSADAAVEAAGTNNYSRSVRWFFWSHSEYDARGDRADERARKWKAAARDAQSLAEDSEKRMQEAASETAKLKGQLTTKQGLRNSKQRAFGEASQKLQEARKKLLEAQKKAEGKRLEFGGLSLVHIAVLRKQLQKFPDLLGDKDRDNTGMFAAIRGALTGHENLCNTIQAFLSSAADQKQAQAMLYVLRPQIQSAIEDATFFAHIQGDFESSLRRLSRSVDEVPAGSITSAPAALSANNSGAQTDSPCIDFGDEPLWD